MDSQFRGADLTREAAPRDYHSVDLFHKWTPPLQLNEENDYCYGSPYNNALAEIRSKTDRLYWQGDTDQNGRGF